MVTCCICWCPTKNGLVNGIIAQNTEERLLIHLFVFVMTPTCGYKTEVMSEWTRWQIQGFSGGQLSLALENGVRYSDTLRVEMLLFAVERSQMRWFEHLVDQDHDSNASP